MNKRTNDDWISCANKIHNGIYNYSKCFYKTKRNKVCIICPKHGDFWQLPNNHLKGQGCPECSLTNRKFSQNYVEIILNEMGLEYIPFFYENSKTQITYNCPCCGNKKTVCIYGVLKGKVLCKKCSIKKNKNIFFEEKQKNAEIILNNLGIEYKPFIFENSYTRIIRKCPICLGWKECSFSQLKKGYILCNKCGKNETNKNNIYIKQIESENNLKELGIVYKPYTFINVNTNIEYQCTSCNEWKQSKYRQIIYQKSILCKKCGLNKLREYFITPQDEVEKLLNNMGIEYLPFDYKNEKETFITIKCPLCNRYSNKRFDDIKYNKRKFCNECYHRTSSGEEDLLDFIKLYEKNINRIKKIDILIPDKNIGFEYNGLWWHSEKYKNNNYHLDKTNFYKEHNIKVFHIWEDDWLYKQDIVKSMISNVLGVTQNKIYARKCEIRLVPVKDKTKFLDKNHIQGSVASKINLGLYYNDNLVSIMTFGYGRNKDFQLSRFCSKLNTNVVGGFSKLLVYFERNYGSQYSEIKTFADRSWSNGDLYLKHGFELVRQTKPDYQYVVNGKRVRKQHFTHKKLIEEGFDPNKSEREIMLERKIYRIYDCGKLVYIWK
jgi:hypothetical protein